MNSITTYKVGLIVQVTLDWNRTSENQSFASPKTAFSKLGEWNEPRVHKLTISKLYSTRWPGNFGLNRCPCIWNPVGRGKSNASPLNNWTVNVWACLPPSFPPPLEVKHRKVFDFRAKTNLRCICSLLTIWTWRHGCCIAHILLHQHILHVVHPTRCVDKTQECPVTHHSYYEVQKCVLNNTLQCGNELFGVSLNLCGRISEWDYIIPQIASYKCS